MKIRTTKQISVDDVQTHPENPNQGDVGAISQSLEYHGGQYRAIVVSEDTGNIVAGNHTYLAARALGETKVLAHLIPGLSHEDEIRIMTGDNQMARLASSDDQLLVDLLSELAASDVGLVATGYDGDDLDTMIAELQRFDEPEDDPVIEVPDDPITKPGDVWQLGNHRLVCGDATDPNTWDTLTDGYDPITVAVTSPPYADRRDYDTTSGFQPIPPDQYVEWFRPIAANVADNLATDGSWFVNIKPGVAPGGLDTEMYVLDLVIAHVREWGWHFATEFCWERNGVPKSVTQRFKNQFEPVYQFTRGRWKMRPDNVRHHSRDVPMPFGEGIGDTGWGGRGGIPGQGKEGSVLPHHRPTRRRNGTTKLISDVQGRQGKDAGEYVGEGLAYPGNRLPTFAGTHTALGHAAAYPIGLPQFFIEAFTDAEDVTCDPMAGTGSSLIAADNTGRIGLAIEISPAYCDVIVKRWESLNPDNQATRLDPME